MTKTLLRKLLTAIPPLIELPNNTPIEVCEAHTHYRTHLDAPGPPLHVKEVHIPTRQPTHFYTNHPKDEGKQKNLNFMKPTEIEPTLVAQDCRVWHLIGPAAFFIHTLEIINLADQLKFFTHPLYATPIIHPQTEFIPFIFQPRLIMPNTKKQARFTLYVPEDVRIELFSTHPIAHLGLFSSLLTPPINEMLCQLDQNLKNFSDHEKSCIPF